MLCTQCAAASYSAAAMTLVERGQPCPRCGGALALAHSESVSASQRSEPELAGPGGRTRFERDA